MTLFHYLQAGGTHAEHAFPHPFPHPLGGAPCTPCGAAPGRHALWTASWVDAPTKMARARSQRGTSTGQLHDWQRGGLRGLWSLSSTWRGRTKWRRSLRCTQKTVGCSGRCSARHGSVLGRSWPGRGQRRAVEKCKCSRGEQKCGAPRKEGKANKSMHLRVPGWQAHNGRSME